MLIKEWLSRNNRKILAAIFTGVIVLSIYGIFLGYPEICYKNEYTNKEECTNYRVLSFFGRRFIQILDQHEGSVVGLATIFLAIFTWRLWWSTRELVRDAKDTSKKELRAYIAATVNNAPAIVLGHDPSVNFSIKNVGKTPAYETTLRVGFGIATFPFVNAELRAFDASAHAHQGRSVLNPDTSMNVTHFSGHNLTANDIRDINVRKDSVLLLRGRIDYEDAFREPRFVTFSFMYGDEFSVRMGSMTATDDGNDADRPA